MTKRLLLGNYEADLNPPLELPIEYSADQKMLGFNDRLYAKAISLRYSDTRVLIVSVDVVAATNDICNEIRIEAENRYSIPRSNIVILATHTHSSPDTSIWPITYTQFDEESTKGLYEFKQNLKKSILYALNESIRHEEEVLSVFHSTTECHGLFTNRDEPTRPIDDSITSLFFKTHTKSLLFVNHNAHPTVLGSNNRGYSADFPGVIAKRVVERLGVDQVNCITGSCADVSVRQTLGDNSSVQRSLENAKRYGTIMGDLVANSFSKASSIFDYELEATSKKVSLEVKQRPDPEEAKNIKAILEEKLKKTSSAIDRIRIEPAIRGVDMWVRALELNHGRIPRTLDLDIGAVYIGKEKFVLTWVPGEIFSYTGMKIKKQSKFELTMVSGYGNGYAGYFPNSQAYENLEYEAISTPMAESAHKVVEEAMLGLVS
ncbi:MAG: hypothetical protein ACYCPW_11380 [Nitrososphaerales archaeon]